MTDRYAVVGHPVAHSKSPRIHALFAAQTAQDMAYDRLLAPLDGFANTVAGFFAAGGRGLNVTVPFKLEARALCVGCTARAAFAGAVNTLWSSSTGVQGDNTDGAGLVADLTRWGSLTSTRVLLLGAGGAACGVLLPLLEAGVGSVHIANRTIARAQALADKAAAMGRGAVTASAYEAVTGRFDLVINATSASLAGDVPPVPRAALAGALAYDMMYGAAPTVFMQAAMAAGARETVDGLGMLVEQAAEAFWVWRGVRPETTAVLATVRAELQGT